MRPLRLRCAPSALAHLAGHVRLTLVAGAAAALSAACSGNPPPPVPTLAPVSVAVAAAEAAPLTARWLPAQKRTFVGPPVAGGTLVVLRGQRAVVAADGAVRYEAAACREAIEEIRLVPVKQGPPRLIGRGSHEVYRFDEALGAAVRSAAVASPIRQMGTAPGLVLVDPGDHSVRRWLDAETLQLVPAPGLPLLDGGMAFRSMTEGVGLFEIAGLSATADGGATWRPVAGGPAARVPGRGVLELGAGVLGVHLGDGAWAAVDPVGATLKEWAPAAGEALIVQWLRGFRGAAGADPLARVASDGIGLPDGSAVVAANGLLARVSPTTGAVLALAPFPEGKDLRACHGARAGKEAFFLCSSTRHDGALKTLFRLARNGFGVESTGIFIEDFRGETLMARRRLRFSGELHTPGELRASPAGGALLTRPCNDAVAPEGYCALQPDGRWQTIPATGVLLNAGPLADGRIAFVEHGNENDRLMAMDTKGGKALLAPLDSAAVAEAGDGGSAVEEDEDHVLRLLLQHTGEASMLTLTPAPEGPFVQRTVLVPGTDRTGFHGDHMVAAARDGVRSSRDGGVTWSLPFAPPEWSAMELRRPENVVRVNELGATVGAAALLGSGDLEADAAPEPPPAAMIPTFRNPPPETDHAVLVACTTVAATTPGAAALTASLFAKLDGSPPPPAPEQRRATTPIGNENGLEREPGRLDREGPAAGKPTTWTVRWLDVRSPRPAVQHCSGPAPEGDTWEAVPRRGSLRIQGSQMVGSFWQEESTREVIRCTAGGRLETAVLPSDDGPDPDSIAIGSEPGKPLVWVQNEKVHVWFAGDVPRDTTLLSAAYAYAGEPLGGSVPILVQTGYSSWFGRISIPRAAPAKGAVLVPERPAISTWSAVVDPLVEGLSPLPTCTAADKGSLLQSATNYVRLTIDGKPRTVGYVRLAVRLQPTYPRGSAGSPGACVAAIDLPAEDDDEQDFVSVDFAAKRVTAVNVRGAGAKKGGVAVYSPRNLTCSLKVVP